MNDMIEKYKALIVKTEYDREKKATEYTCEYEKDGSKQTASFFGASSMAVEEGSTIEITVEDGVITDTNIGQIIGANSIFMLICLLIFLAAIILLFIWFVKTKYTAVRICIAVFAAAFIILTHIPTGSRKDKK
ncbi:hypothetical protein RF007C_12095 [Ruminococcus flavefaciens 007c]|uniref:Uncharacterized protein n=2 Tax=Ruminococcus flavefaciens TaxID=1265 RepID=W7USF6_RUMFL|nr:hypothetical protein RF007C_12095 [Ruminococcus flavefaciens 007c]